MRSFGKAVEFYDNAAHRVGRRTSRPPTAESAGAGAVLCYSAARGLRPAPCSVEPTGFPPAFEDRSASMSYKTILVQVDDSRHADPRIEAAANIAVTENAHLIGLAATGVAEMLLYAPLSPADPGALEPYLETLRQRATAALQNFENIARRIGVASYEAQLVENETALGVSLRARCCDLVVLGQFSYRRLMGFAIALPILLHYRMRYRAQ
jgi:nucleotide-binding universal stress UspA family protein